MFVSLFRLGVFSLGVLGIYKLIEDREDDMARVFISFDFDNDRNYAYLLKAMSGNSAFSQIKFRDNTSGEIKSDDIGRIKAALTNKIKDSTHTVVVVGKYANSLHRDRAKIGANNWQHWEIKKSLELGNKLVMVKLDKSNESPTPAYHANAAWAYAYTVDSIAAALHG